MLEEIADLPSSDVAERVDYLIFSISYFNPLRV